MMQISVDARTRHEPEEFALTGVTIAWADDHAAGEVTVTPEQAIHLASRLETILGIFRHGFSANTDGVRPVG